MTDISKKTWKYLHGPDDVIHLSFPTGGVPRSFSAVQYVAHEDNEIDFKRNGVAVIDNDKLCIVLDGHLENQELSQLRFMSALREMSWASFSTFCTDHPRFRSPAEDMYRDQPEPGVIVNQIQRGVMHIPENEGDLRSPSMVKANADEQCPYSFPPASRSQMISEILQHSCLRGQDGQWRIAWESQLDNALPALGVAEDEVEAHQDWAEYYEANPEIFHQISGEILEPFFSGQVGSWPKTDAGRYGFIAPDDGSSSAICLASIDGADIGFQGRGELGAFLNDIEDVALREMWKLIRVVDHDLSKSVIDAAFEAGLEEARARFHLDRENALDLVSEPV